MYYAYCQEYQRKRRKRQSRRHTGRMDSIQQQQQKKTKNKNKDDWRQSEGFRKLLEEGYYIQSTITRVQCLLFCYGGYFPLLSFTRLFKQL